MVLVVVMIVVVVVMVAVTVFALTRRLIMYNSTSPPHMCAAS
jgi:hypothetical protein